MRLDEANKPRIVFINRMGRENASFEKAIDSLREAFPDSNIVPFQLPIGQGEDFEGVISLVTGKAYLGSEGKVVPVPDAMAEAVETAQVALVEAAAEADDEIIMKYFDGEELTPEEVRRGLHRGVRSGAIVPVYCGSALSDIGLDRVLKAMVRYVPAPNERAVPAVQDGEALELQSDSSGPVAASVFKTIIDRYVGRMNYVRVFSGTVNKDATLINARTDESYRVANLNSVRGKDLEAVDSLVAGDIGVVTKLDDLLTGDTITKADAKVAVDPPVYPRPLYSVSVTPATKADSAKMGQSLHSLIEEDPTLRVQNISATRQNVLQGMGEAHVDVAIRRLENKFGVSVQTAVPKVPYQETISHTGQAQYRHKKQTGGAGQFAEVHMRVEPLAARRRFPVYK